MKNETCKYCEKEALYSFGWIDSRGQWQDQHGVCDGHKDISFMQQNISMSLDQLRNRWRHESVIHVLCNNP